MFHFTSHVHLTVLKGQATNFTCQSQVCHFFSPFRESELKAGSFAAVVLKLGAFQSIGRM